MCRPSVQILLQTASIVVVAKPSGVAVHRGWAEDRYPLLQRVRDALGGTWVYPVHRLDRATSGAVIFARSSEAAARLSEGFRGAAHEKRYVALTRGLLDEEGTIDHPVPRNKSKQSERVPARTHFARLATQGRFSWALVRPETGRLHQIRRHFKHLSHPLVGDVRYGKGEINRAFRSDCGLHRLALHALAIAFEDPETAQVHRVHAPLPDDLRQPLLRFGLPEAALDFDPWAPVNEKRLRGDPKEREFLAP